MKACLFIYIIFELVHWKVSFVELIELNQSESETLRISVMELSSKTKPLLLLLLLLFTFSSVSESNQVVTSSSTLISIPCSISTFLFLQPKKISGLLRKPRNRKEKIKLASFWSLWFTCFSFIKVKYFSSQLCFCSERDKVEHADHLCAIKKIEKSKQKYDFVLFFLSGFFLL